MYYRSLPTTSLLALVAAPQALALSRPAAVAAVVERRASSPCCSERTMHNFAWTVTDFEYHASYVFSTPAHQNSWGYVDFNLSNPAVPDAVATCHAASNQLSDFFYGTVWYDCALNGTTTGGGPAPATFAFSRPSGELKVNQTWTCDDQDPKYPTRFSGAGSVNLTLDCVETQYQNPNWTVGQIYSDREITCQPVTTLVQPYEMTAVA